MSLCCRSMRSDRWTLSFAQRCFRENDVVVAVMVADRLIVAEIQFHVSIADDRIGCCC